MVLLKRLEKFKSQRSAIILCDGENVLESINYEETLLLSKKVIGELAHMFISPQCIGVLMEHNIYLPTVLIR